MEPSVPTLRTFSVLWLVPPLLRPGFSLCLASWCGIRWDLVALEQSWVLGAEAGVRSPGAAPRAWVPLGERRGPALEGTGAAESGMLLAAVRGGVAWLSRGDRTRTCCLGNSRQGAGWDRQGRRVP